ncbi:hypothetical protein [Ruminococcus flavefaciens]|uniref:hypothetical protein n=1 Tax=Ruminococcus flavefaciens TaxID=1265 RepID=UPI000490816B|nr:hypothetical protein [Ruminococcus flavefaciens]
MIKIIIVYTVPLLLLTLAVISMTNHGKKEKKCGIAQLVLTLPPLITTLIILAANLTNKAVSEDTETVRRILYYGEVAVGLLFTVGLVYYGVLAIIELVLMALIKASSPKLGRAYLTAFCICAAMPLLLYSFYPIFD